MARTRTGKIKAVDTLLSGTAEAESKRETPETGGQSGDTQGLSDVAESDSESVKELAEEGQYFEAAVVSGIENAPDADEGGVKTREVPEDDVPGEYVERDPEERNRE
ncbi:MAG TPA: hypothetical protein VGH38_33900 [Bryobacteraceae bacterium]